MRRPGPAAALTLIFGALTLAAPRQDPPGEMPGFRAATETVPIYATVLNRYGEPIRDLAPDDFRVFDDGRLQRLTVFEAGLQPITAAVMVDTSASMTLNLELALAAAEQFVIRLLPADRARVGHFSDRIDMSPGFTGDRDALLRYFREELQFGNPTKLWETVDRTIATLEPLGGRRVVVLMTDGMDTASDLPPAGVLARAAVSEVMIYVVQFRSSLAANAAEFPRAPSASELFSSDMRAIRASPGLLARMAWQSGGGYFILGPYDDVNATFSAVLQELHYQYVLGFAPDVADGRVHEIRIQVERPDLIVRSRRSYLAPRPLVATP